MPFADTADHSVPGVLVEVAEGRLGHAVAEVGTPAPQHRIQLAQQDCKRRMRRPGSQRAAPTDDGGQCLLRRGRCRPRLFVPRFRFRWMRNPRKSNPWSMWQTLVLAPTGAGPSGQVPPLPLPAGPEHVPQFRLHLGPFGLEPQHVGIHRRSPAIPKPTLRIRCRPWPCDRLSRPRTTTTAPPRPGPISRRRTCPHPTWMARTRDQPETLPTFTTYRSTGSVPKTPARPPRPPSPRRLAPTRHAPRAHGTDLTLNSCTRTCWQPRPIGVSLRTT